MGAEANGRGIIMTFHLSLPDHTCQVTKGIVIHDIHGENSRQEPVLIFSVSSTVDFIKQVIENYDNCCITIDKLELQKILDDTKEDAKPEEWRNYHCCRNFLSRIAYGGIQKLNLPCEESKKQVLEYMEDLIWNKIA
jgi:hypothetical protein